MRPSIAVQLFATNCFCSSTIHALNPSIHPRRAVEYTLDYEVQRPLLFGGPFKSPYIFEMIHFHWGPLKSSGSEHAINSRPYHMEMHITHRHPSYQDMTEAAKHKNGIVVLAFLFDVRV